MHRPVDTQKLPPPILNFDTVNKMSTRTPPKITPGNPKAAPNKDDVPEIIYDGTRRISYQRGRFLGKVCKKLTKHMTLPHQVFAF